MTKIYIAWPLEIEFGFQNEALIQISIQLDFFRSANAWKKATVCILLETMLKNLSCYLLEPESNIWTLELHVELGLQNEALIYPIRLVPEAFRGANSGSKLRYLRYFCILLEIIQKNLSYYPLEAVSNVLTSKIYLMSTACT